VPSCLCAFVFLGGCARPTVATVAPSDEELLVLPELERVVPVRVGVEGRGEEPRRVFVQRYEVPALTEEEKEALGIEEPRINFLEFYQPPRLGVWPYTGGVDTFQAGLGGAAAGVTGYEPVSAMWAAEGGAGVGTLPEGTRRYGQSGRTEGATGRAGLAGVRVGENPPRRVSAREPRAERY
jgi:hypothetical protein